MLRRLASMAHDDEALYDLAKGMPKDYEPPEYPGGLMFCITLADLAKAGGEGGKVGDAMHFSAMGEVTSIYRGKDGPRIELEANEFAGEDGKFFDLEQPAHICLCGPELEKMELEDDCELGDMIHLIGSARLESTSEHEFGQTAMMQITDMTFEDESEESREGGE